MFQRLDDIVSLTFDDSQLPLKLGMINYCFHQVILTTDLEHFGMEVRVDCKEFTKLEGCFFPPSFRGQEG
jgi:hypothetical protein